MPHLSRSRWPHVDSPAPAAVVGEKDACGVGFLAHLDGVPNHWVLQQALRGLGCMEHRGGCGGDGDSGDGAGILCGIPWTFLEAVWPEAAASSGLLRGLAMLFLPADPARHQEARDVCEQEAARLGLRSLGWRPVPVSPDVLGPLARQTAPSIEQWLIAAPSADGPADAEAINALEALLFRLRRRAVDRVRDIWGPQTTDLYFAYGFYETRDVDNAMVAGEFDNSIIAAGIGGKYLFD